MQKSEVNSETNYNSSSECDELVHVRRCRRGGHWRPVTSFIDSKGKDTLTCNICLDAQRKRRKSRASSFVKPKRELDEENISDSARYDADQSKIHQASDTSKDTSVAEEDLSESNQNENSIPKSSRAEFLKLCKRGRHWRPHRSFHDMEGTETATCFDCLSRQRKNRDQHKKHGVAPPAKIKQMTDPIIPSCILPGEMEAFIETTRAQAKNCKNAIHICSSILLSHCSDPKALALYIRDKILEGTGYYFTFNAFSIIKRNVHNSVSHFYCSQDMKRKWEPKKIEQENLQYIEPKPLNQGRESVKVYDCEGKLSIRIDMLNNIAEISISHKGHSPYHGKIMREIYGLKRWVEKDGIHVLNAGNSQAAPLSSFISSDRLISSIGEDDGHEKLSQLKLEGDQSQPPFRFILPLSQESALRDAAGATPSSTAGDAVDQAKYFSEVDATAAESNASHGCGRVIVYKDRVSMQQGDHTINSEVWQSEKDSAAELFAKLHELVKRLECNRINYEFLRSVRRSIDTVEELPVLPDVYEG